MTPVAVVAAGALLPGSPGVGAFWRTLVDGRDHMTDVPASRWSVDDHYDPDPRAVDKTYGRRGAFLPEIDFDPLRYGIPPNKLSAIDTSQLLALVVADRVLAGCRLPARDRIGVVIGASGLPRMVEASARLQRPVWRRVLREYGLADDVAQVICDRIADHYVPWQEETFPGLLTNVVSGRIANRFDLHGMNHTVDAACASSLAALHAGIAELDLGRADLVLTGGVDTMNDVTMFTCFSRTPALSPTGDCRPFAADADGTMLGEGLVLFALKRLADAERDGDPVYAVVRGVGAASDGKGGAVFAPAPAGQARALRSAYAAAGYGPSSVELLEAHGTGTSAGDLAEFTALRTVFEGPGLDGGAQWCALGSVKSQIGHTKSAAGAAGLLKAVLALHHKVLPPTIKVGQPAFDLASSPFYLNTATRPWIRSSAHPRRASVSSFGFGGTNFHVTVEEYGGSSRPPRTRAVPSELVLVSASSVDSLSVDLDGDLAEVARRSLSSFDPSAPVRLAVVARDTDELAAVVARVAGGQPLGPRTLASVVAAPASPGKIGFLFPGQGSQFVGMGADLAVHYDLARTAWDRAADLDPDLPRVVFPPPAFTDAERAAREAALTATDRAQPALAVHGLALLALLDAVGLVADCMAGHSFGELVALHAAGAYDADTLVRLARRRGDLMAGSGGGMLAVAADLETVTAAVAGHCDVWVANHNAPRQVVLAGTLPGLDAAADRLVADGVAVTRLNAACGFHSPLVAPARDHLLTYLRDLDVSAPKGVVYGTAGGRVYDPLSVRERLAAQVAEPVAFVESVEAMYTAGVRTFVEVGPGTVLCGLVGKILGERPHTAVALDRPGHHGLTSLQNALGRLAVQGVQMDLESLSAQAGEGDGAPAEPLSKSAVRVNGGNYGRPHPPEAAGGLPPVTPLVPNPRDVPAPQDRDSPTESHDAPPDEAPQGPPPAPDVASVDPPAVAAVPPGMPPGMPPAVEDAWLRLIENAQRQLAEVQTAFQRTMAESHAAYMRMAEATMTGVLGAVTGQPPPAGRSPLAPAAEMMPPAPPTGPAPAPIEPAPIEPIEPTAAAGEPHPAVASAEAIRADPIQAAPDAGPERLGSFPATAAVAHAEPTPPAPVTEPVPAPVALPAIPAERRPAASAAPMPSAPAPVSVPPAAAPPESVQQLTLLPALLDPSAEDVGAVLLSVVAERTGYPVEVLDVDMALDTDLGIDSIKKVEILSAVRDRVGEAPDGELSALASLRTLRDIAERFAGTPAQPPAAQPPVQLPPVPVQAQPTAKSAVTATLDPTPAFAAAPKTAPKALPTTTTAAPRADLLRQVLRPVPAPRSGLSMPGLTHGLIAVTDDGRGIAPLVVTGLRRHGLDAKVVAEVPADAHGVIALHGLRPVVSVDSAAEAQRAALRAARAVAKRMESGSGGVFVTVQDTGGDFGLATPAESHKAWLGGLRALTQTISKEWPATTVKAIDCATDGRSAAAVADDIVAELVSGAGATQVGLRGDGTRVVPVLTDAPVRGSRAQRLATGSLVVVSGGARGVTAAALKPIVADRKPRLVILGRTPLSAEPPGLAAAEDEPSLIRVLAERNPGPPADVAAQARRILAAREINETLTSLRREGVECRYVSVDVRDTEAVRDTLEFVRMDWGPVSAVIHGAGVLADARIADKTDEQFVRVFGTKVHGLDALLAATAEDPLEVLCVFSSVAAVFGNAGQADYAMANEVLGQVLASEQARRPGCLVRALAWGPWQGGMVTPTLAERFRDSGVALIDPAAGARAFAEEMAGPVAGDVVVVRAARGDYGTGVSAAGEVDVTGAAYPYLTDHRINNVPVLPVATVLDWFARIARAGQPDRAGLVLHDVRVLDKVTLPLLGRAGYRLALGARESAADGVTKIELDLTDDTGHTHFRAAATGGTSATEHWAAPTGLEPLDDPYDLLFHGPAMRVLRGAPAVGPGGAYGAVAGSAAMGWPRNGDPAGTEVEIDVAAVDGALQMALLWAKRAGAGDTLPMSVIEVRLHRRGAVAGEVRCVVHAVRADDAGAVCDIALLDADGAPRVELLGVHLVRRPGG